MEIIINLLITAFISIIAIGFIVFIHEFGHFLAAKLSGVVVQEFAFGFGRKIFSKKHNGTEYKINVFPFGGYIKMLGDVDGSSLTRFRAELLTKEETKFISSLFRKHNISIKKDDFDKVYSFFLSQKKNMSEKDYKVLKKFIERDYIPNNPGNYDKVATVRKVFIITAGVIMNFLLGVLLLYVYFGLNGNYTDLRKIGTPTFIGAEVNEPPILWFEYSTDNIGESIVINANNILVKNNAELLAIAKENYNKPINLYVLNFRQNKYLNVPMVLDGDGIRSNFDEDFTNKVMVTTISPQGFAEQVGIKLGDILKSINGKPIIDVAEFKADLNNNIGKEVVLEKFNEVGLLETLKFQLPLVADGEPILNVGLSKTEIILSKYGELLSAMRLTYEQYPYLSGIFHAVNMTTYNFSAFGELIKQSMQMKSIQPVSQSVSSILAVPDIFYSLIKGNNYLELFNIAALISISLAIMNILPIPLFDGGHLLFIFLAKIRGRELSMKMQERIGNIMFYSLIVFAIVIIFKDVIQFDWFNRVMGLFGSFFK